MNRRNSISWFAGAALYLFVFGVISAIVGPSAIVSLLFVGVASALVARQWRRRRRPAPRDIRAR
jgi:hypothetical protein